ncbi:porin [Flavisphingomonas formosensis]|uniref:porin n=1 Tax=Flavisphingomonas formosensis TaxID=861534 RepID=UPI0012FC9AD1|nr:porin [Sphingomonas formosensis]
MPARLIGVSALALIAATPALAQNKPDPGDAFALPAETQPATSDQQIDTRAPADKPAEAAPVAATGDPVLDRLNALEAKIKALEARNAQLEEQSRFNEDRIEKVETRAAKAVQFTWAPTLSDVGGNFTFKPRGMLELDYAGYNSRAGGYQFNNGTQIRRGRFGFEGTAFRTFAYRVEAEYVNNAVNLLDAYIQYNGFKKLSITVGQQKAPYGLEANTSDAFNTFLERGMANVAFGAVGAERRVGATLAYSTDHLYATVGIFGAGEAVNRNATTPGETYGFNGRVVWEPINDTNRLVHVGVSGYKVTDFAANSLTIGDRPNSRVDGGLITSVSITGTNPANGVQTGVKNATFVGGEAAFVYGPFSVQGEYDHLTLNRFEAGNPNNTNLHFNGFYVFGSFFLTGESRSFRGGVVDRLKPFRDFNPQKGNWGAFEVALRYDKLNLTDHDLSPLTREATSWTTALNWYLNGNVKFMFNWVRFKGLNSPLAVAPVAINGTTVKGDVFGSRLHLDF